MKEIQVKDSFIQKIFGCESAIAYKNMKRNKYGYKATIRALSLGILLFLLTGGLSGQAKEFQEWMTPKSKRNDGGLFFQLRYLGKCENRERREKNKPACYIRPI